MIRPGIYRHFKDGRFYLVLWQAIMEEAAPAADVDLHVWGQGVWEQTQKGYFYVTASAAFYRERKVELCHLATARAHGSLKEGDAVAVYVPLHSDKPGRRISVRRVSEFTELLCAGCHKPLDPAVATGQPKTLCANDDNKAHDIVPRFTYIGDTIPGTK